jgi:uncharacterized protein YjbI with pentapeptide repeats
MANVSCGGTTFVNTNFSGMWRNHVAHVPPVLLVHAHHPHATRAGANLSGADLSNSTLTGVKLSEAKLHGFPPTKLPQGFQP